MKRFWDAADIVAVGGGWGVALDGKPVRIPGGAALNLPCEPLAHAIAREWSNAGTAKGGEMSWADVPLTRLAGTAQERIAPDPEPIVLELARYGESDLLCYRAERPDALVQRQAASWQPWLDWAAEALGARLSVTTGIIHVAQEPAALAALAGHLAAETPHRLAALGVLIPALGSVVLGLAIAADALDAAQAHALAMLDEQFQAQLWGEDAEAAARRAAIAADIATAARFLGLARDTPPRLQMPRTDAA